MEAIGIDVGFGFTKASNGAQSIVFKSLIGDHTDIQFQSEFEDTSQVNNLHVQLQDTNYFVGEMAERQSTVRQFTLDQDKLINEFVKVLALTAIGLCSDGDKPSVNVVSGLPVGFFKRDSSHFKQTLQGSHRLTLFDRRGGEESKQVYINKVKLLPQPMGSVFNLLMDHSGNLTDKRMAKQKLGVVDIGFRTTDFILLDRLRYIERGSSTTNNGMAKCFNLIANKLRQKTGVSVELYRIYEAVTSGSIRIKGKEYNISALRDRIFAHYAGIIAHDINRIWDQDWDIDAFILTGGGARELAPHIYPLLEGNVRTAVQESDPRLNNVLGYCKYGRYDLKKGSQMAETASAEAGQPQAAKLKTAASG